MKIRTIKKTTEKIKEIDERSVRGRGFDSPAPLTPTHENPQNSLCSFRGTPTRKRQKGYPF